MSSTANSQLRNFSKLAMSFTLGLLISSAVGFMPNAIADSSQNPAFDKAVSSMQAKNYNDAIELCLKVKDAGTRELLAGILVSSEEHVDWLETQLALIKSVGLQNYLSEQLGGDQK